MLLLREFLTPHLLLTELITQNLHVLPSFFSARLVVSTRIEVSWALDGFDKLSFVASIEILHV